MNHDSGWGDGSKEDTKDAEFDLTRALEFQCPKFSSVV